MFKLAQPCLDIAPVQIFSRLSCVLIVHPFVFKHNEDQQKLDPRWFIYMFLLFGKVCFLQIAQRFLGIPIMLICRLAHFLRIQEGAAFLGIPRP